MKTKYGDLEFDANLNWQPVQIVKKWRDTINLPLAEYTVNSIVVNSLEPIKQVVREINKQRVIIVKPEQYK